MTHTLHTRTRGWLLPCGWRVAVLLSAFAVTIPFEPAAACLWDTDTLEQERSRFPSTLELITGKFLRHSRAFYVWRADQRRTLIEQGDRRPEYYDDIAVAMDKIGHSQSAIRWMRDKDRVYPGRYETYANLGTFHIHAGQWEQGAEFIRKALELNPDAHFGREKYQLMLVNYQLARQASGSEKDEDVAGAGPMGLTGFAAYVIQQRREELSTTDGESLTSEERNKALADALEGIQGMMRFGHYDSPILLEALGDLLVLPHSPDLDARRLAARAYLQGAQKSTDGEAKARLIQKARSVVRMHENLTLNSIRTRLIDEIQEANAWFGELNKREREWIRSPEKDPEAEFLKLYSQEPLIGLEPLTPSKSKFGWAVISKRLAALLTAMLVVCAVLGFFLARNGLRQPGISFISPLK